MRARREPPVSDVASIILPNSMGITACSNTARTKQIVAAAIAGHSGRLCRRIRRTPAAGFAVGVAVGSSSGAARSSPLVWCMGEAASCCIITAGLGALAAHKC